MSSSFKGRKNIEEELMSKIAKGLDSIFNGHDPKNPEVGFVLLVFPLNKKTGLCNYIANIKDESIFALLEEQLKTYKKVKRLEDEVRGMCNRYH